MSQKYAFPVRLVNPPQSSVSIDDEGGVTIGEYEVIKKGYINNELIEWRDSSLSTQTTVYLGGEEKPLIKCNNNKYFINPDLLSESFGGLTDEQTRVLNNIDITSDDEYHSIKIGHNTYANSSQNIVIGGNAGAAYCDRTVVNGYNAYCFDNANDSIAIGCGAHCNTNSYSSIAIGHYARCNNGANNSIAIGHDVQNNTSNSFAIGFGNGYQLTIGGVSIDNGTGHLYFELSNGTNKYSWHFDGSYFSGGGYGAF